MFRVVRAASAIAVTLADQAGRVFAASQVTLAER